VGCRDYNRNLKALGSIYSQNTVKLVDYDFVTPIRDADFSMWEDSK
jgi:hypothetical protein